MTMHLLSDDDVRRLADQHGLTFEHVRTMEGVVLQGLVDAGYNVTVNTEGLTVDELSVKVRDGQLRLRASGGGSFRQAATVLAVAGHIMLADDVDEDFPTPADNYRMALFKASDQSEVIEVASCRSFEQTPHALRVSAEKLLREAVDVLEAVSAGFCGSDAEARSKSILTRLEGRTWAPPLESSCVDLT